MAPETVKKVWHIFHYDELFRAVDQKNPNRWIPLVLYSQRPIIGCNEYSEQYIQQMAALKLQSKAIEQYVMAKHVFEELLDRSQKYHRGNQYLRGYILNEKLMPADSDRIAAMLEFDKRATKRYLSWLEEVGLIELVEMPKLKTAAELKAEKNEDDSAKNADNLGEKPEMWNRVDTAAQNSTGLQESGKRVTGKGNTKNKYPGTDKGKEKNNPNPKGIGEHDLQEQIGELIRPPKAELKPEPEGACGTVEASNAATNAEAQNQNPTAPTKTDGAPPGSRTAAQESGINPNPTAYPTQPDGGPPGSRTAAHGGNRALEDTSLARDCLGFAEELYRRLGLQPTEKNPMAAEIEAWSNAWRRAIAANPDTQWLLVLRIKVLKKADKLRNRRGPGNKSAILMHEFNKRILSGKAA
jgi:hypothetical protein